jgi:hypothetical protein
MPRVYLPTAPSKLPGAVIRLVVREAASWKASGGASSAGGAGGSGCSASADDVREAKSEAEAELQKLLSSGLDAKMVQRDLRTALLGGADALFKSLCDPVALEAVSPSRLEGSATLAILTMIQAAIEEPSESGLPKVRVGGYLASRIISASLPLFKGAKERSDEAGLDKMAGLIEYFITEVCIKTWGVEDAWSDLVLGDDVYSPLEAAVKTSSLPLVGAVLRNGRAADVAEAAYKAYVLEDAAVFHLLIETERCLEGTGDLLIARFFDFLHIRARAGEAVRVQRQREEMLDRFLHRWPQTLETLWPIQEDKTCHRALEAAICLRSDKLVITVLSLGSPIRYDNSKVVFDREAYSFYPTLYYALSFPSLPVMTLLVERGILESWQAKYNEDALEEVAAGLAVTVMSCYPPAAPSSSHAAAGPYRPDGLATLDFVLSTGFSYSWMRDVDGRYVNTCLNALLGRSGERLMSEEHIIDLLSRCRAAGMDIFHMEKGDVGKPNGVSLAAQAANKGLNKVVDFALTLDESLVDEWYVGRDKKGEQIKMTPLRSAIINRHLSTAKHLLHVHKAKAAYHTLPLNAKIEPTDQPIMQALYLENDDTALPFVRELIKADPLLCDIDCFRELGSETPIGMCCVIPLPKCLEALLSANLPGVKEMCSKPTRVAATTGHHFFEHTPASMLADNGDWGLLAMMVRHCPEVSVIVPAKFLRADGAPLHDLPSVLERAEQLRAPRYLLLKLRAMAKQQQADAEKAKVIAANSAVPSNAFEDPTTKVLTEAEEKKKAKRKEQKKKARAKKRAAAATKEGHAGAGKEQGEADSDSDSSGPDDEEEGMDEEERMLARAPTFDLEKERAARKVRAEAEKSKETKE